MRRPAALAVLALLLGLAFAPAAAARAATPTPDARPDAAQVVTTVRDPRIDESSGLAISAARPDVVWTVNDSGAAAVVYGVSTRTGRTLARVRLVDDGGRGVDVVDTESLASAVGTDGRRSLLVGDIGDNRRSRGSVALLRLPEPTSVRDAAARVARLPFRYEGGPVDAEALVATADGRLLVIAKAVLRADVYEVPMAAVGRLLAGRSAAEPVVARKVARINQMLVTGADALPGGGIVVRGYGAATTYRWQGGDLVADQAVALPEQRQGEAIAVEPGGRTALVSSEGVSQPLYRVVLPVVLPEEGSPTGATTSASGRPSNGPSSTGPSSTGPATTQTTDDGPPLARIAASVGGVAFLGALAVVGVRGARRRGRRTP